MRYLAFIIVLLCVTITTAHSQKFYVETNGTKVVEGSYVELRFILEDANGGDFSPPNFNDFDVVSGPSTSQSTSIVNGQMSRSYTVTYGLQPKSKGAYTIGAATIKTKSGPLKTQPLKITVIKGNKAAIDPEKQAFVKATVSDSTIFVGQQILLQYTLYTTLDVRQFDFRTEQPFDGFYAEELKLGRIAFTKEIIDGREYYARPIKVVALFPQQTGTYDIAPMVVDMGIAKPGQSRGFFSSARLTPKRVNTEGIKIEVRGMPRSTEPYTGAVGRYNMKVNTGKSTLTTDDAIVVQMEVTGNGDNKTVQAPKWTLPEGLEMYDPNTLSEQVMPSIKGITHKKVFEYLIVAKKPGRYTLEPNFTYFNTDTDTYKTLTKRLPSITVLKGNNVASVATTKTKAELVGIYEQTTLKSPSRAIHNSLLHLGGLGVLFLGGLGIYGYSSYLQTSGRLDPSLIKKNKAYEIAATRLKKSKTLLDQNASKAFHEEMIVALKGYITDKYSIPALHLKKSELLTELGKAGLSSDYLDIFKTLLDRSEMAMYAPGMAPPLTDTYDQALGLIAELEK